MDLVVAMAPCVDDVTMSKTYELIKPYLEVRTVDHHYLLSTWLFSHFKESQRDFCDLSGLQCILGT